MYTNDLDFIDDDIGRRFEVSVFNTPPCCGRSMDLFLEDTLLLDIGISPSMVPYDTILKLYNCTIVLQNYVDLSTKKPPVASLFFARENFYSA